jgi:DNA replication and repair protein RecF
VTVNPTARCTPAITRLQLQNFRSYPRADLKFDGRIVVLTGPNGAGKTNLLEALSFLAPGRGLRRAALSDVQRLNGAAPSPAWAVAATVEVAGGPPITIGTGLERDDGAERRALRIDGAPQRGQAALSELLTVAWLTPPMDRLFIEGAAGRRRFFDRLVQAHDPQHAGRLGAYEHALRERARLLREHRAEPAWLDALEDAMARHAVATAAARRALCGQLAAAVALGVGPFPAADLALDGELERALEATPALAVEEAFRATLQAQRALDADRGTTSRGVHKTDLRVRHRAKNAPAEQCSTGEQKALLIALQLAHARLLRATTGSAPVLLLDEVAAHLDETRRTALFEELQALPGQAWLTGTDPVLFRPLKAAAQWLAVAEAGRPAAVESGPESSPESGLSQGEIP